MTCCAAIETGDGRVVVACDAFVGNEGSRDMCDAPKWLEYSRELVVAFSGEIYPARLLATGPRHAPRRGETDEAYLDRVLEHVRKAHVERDKSLDQSTWLLAYRGKVYFTVDYAVVRSRRGFCAIGSGDTAATSALVALGLAASKLPPAERLRVALSTAAAVVPTVCEPFTSIVVGAPRRPRR